MEDNSKEFREGVRDAVDIVQLYHLSRRGISTYNARQTVNYKVTKVNTSSTPTTKPTPTTLNKDKGDNGGFLSISAYTQLIP